MIWILLLLINALSPVILLGLIQQPIIVISIIVFAINTSGKQNIWAILRISISFPLVFQCIYE